jgi:transcriptional regulator with GAF, ATPase, and Fis domain
MSHDSATNPSNSRHHDHLAGDRPPDDRVPDDRVPGDRVPDDRVPYDIAEAVIRTVAHYSDVLTDERAVMRAIRDYKGPQYTEYLTAIARTRHSIFYHQLQELYEIARTQVRPELADEVCFLAGQDFARHLLAENPAPLEQVALAPEGSFQKTFVDVIRAYLVRFTGDKYVADIDYEADRILIRLGWRNPEGIRTYLAQYGCEPEGSLRNSLSYIAGAIEHFVTRLAARHDPDRFRVEWTPDGARVHVPVREDDRVNYDTLIHTFADRIRKLETRQQEHGAIAEATSDTLVASAAMRTTWHRLRRAARSNELILVRGESGTGKSFLARQVHGLSGRRDGPFVEVSLTSDVGSDNLVQSDLFGHERGAFTGATAQKQGLFSLADGGTIFLDEIGDASPELQARLLRVLETGQFKRLGGVRDLQVDVRVIAATNRDLELMVEQGQFRQDLYFRLNVIPLHVPPLRERDDEIAELAQHLFERLLAEGADSSRVLPSELAERLSDHDWPGNVRELEHALRHAIAMAEGASIQLEDLPEAVIKSLRAAEEGELRPGPVKQASIDESGTIAEKIVDVEALRRAIRAAHPLELASAETPRRFPAHIDHARRVWLSTLIDECHGDLALIASFWDRGSEKTLRNLVRQLGLTDRLAAARAKHRARSSPR